MGNKEKEFNTILDECLDRVLFTGETPEQCIVSYPELADELRPLLDAAIVTAPIKDLEPRPEFKSKARSEFFTYLSEAEAQRKPSFFNWFSWHRRLATGMALVIAIIAATGGTAYASLDSMPDDFLYPVKRATENVQLAFTFTSIGKAEAYARMADNRVEEIVYMATTNDSEEIELLASSLNSNLLNIAAISSRDDGSAVLAEESAQGSMITSATFDEPMTAKAITEEAFDTGAAVGGQSEEMEVLSMDDADSDDEAATNDAFTTADGVESMDVTAMTEDPAPTMAAARELPPDTELDPRLVLNNTIIDQASSNIALLYDLLDIVPESIRPAIERAIMLSEQGYEIAINSLQP